MPTANPRVNVVLSPSLDSLVCKLAALERVSKSMVLRELLEAAEPALREAVALMEAAEGASMKARKQVARDISQSVRVIQEQSDAVLGALAHHTRDLVAEAEAVRGRRPSRARRVAPAGTVPATSSRRARSRGDSGAVSDTPPSNRGVKS